jgi:hypothetical protein
VSCGMAVRLHGGGAVKAVGGPEGVGYSMKGGRRRNLEGVEHRLGRSEVVGEARREEDQL